MLEQALATLLNNGLPGIVIIILTLAVVRLFNMLQAAQKEKEEYLREDRKALLEAINEGADAADRLTQWVKSADRQ
jgi:hypothetical protein